jgi:hypothetical protein
MKDVDVQKLVQIRQYVIDCHRSLDGASSPGTSVVKQIDVAYEFEQVIRMIDGVLSQYVNFE